MSRKIIPVSRLIRIEAEIRRLVDEVLERNRFYSHLYENWIPSLDISEREEDVVVEVELPGIQPKDVTILLHSNRLEIHGIKKKENLDGKIKYFRMEREYGPFRCIVFLPCSVQNEKAEAIQENGVLRIRLKKDRKGDKEVVIEITKSEEVKGG